VHGPANNHCPGSGSLTSAANRAEASSSQVDPADQSQDLFDASSLDSNTAGTGSLSLPLPKGKILKRIPRGARDAAAAELQRQLIAVEKSPADRSNWTELFSFASGCLRQPSDRGGKRQNLTTAVINNIKSFSAGLESEDHQSHATKQSKLKTDSASIEAGIARRAAAKLDEGDVKGAVRSLCSSDTLQKPTLLSFQKIKDKHPPAPADRRPLDKQLPGSPLTVTSEAVLEAINSFPAGSSGGPDGLRPQHLKDLTNRQIGGSLLEAITNFVNFVLSGKTPTWVCPFLFGASLLAFNKKDGGIRPIAVGLTLRRLVAKVACRITAIKFADILKPKQLGVGVKGGAEALVHAARRFVDFMPESHSFVKLDFVNAFNTLRRDCMIEAVSALAPELLGYVLSAYGSPSNLTFGEFTIESMEGVQQGDPLGPFYFA